MNHLAFQNLLLTGALLSLVSCGPPADRSQSVAAAPDSDARAAINPIPEPTEPAEDPEPGNPVVVFETTKGDIVLELDPARAPGTVANFLEYVEDGFYDGTIFHRVIPGFMIQGGGFNEAMEQKRTRDPIKNEADNGLRNRRGTIAMARTGVVDSATSQFFINVSDNAQLNHSQRDFGYAVFGEVTSGMDVVDAIVESPTVRRGMHRNVPRDPIVVTSARARN